jgi:hypothetical protein
MGEMTNGYKILFGKTEWAGHFRDISIKGRITLKLI